MKTDIEHQLIELGADAAVREYVLGVVSQLYGKLAELNVTLSQEYMVRRDLERRLEALESSTCYTPIDNTPFLGI